jgi:photosystem II stability/assembly factor-like uncharacterized protein
MAKAKKKSAKKGKGKAGKSAKKPVGKRAPKKKSGGAPKVSGKKGSIFVLVGTRKGGFILRSDGARKKWDIQGPHFLGHIVYHLVLDPRDQRTMLMTCRAGHLGPSMFRSTDFGKSWHEAERPPAYPKAADGKGRVVDHTFWLTPGHASEPGVWYGGASPQGLFRTEDGGRTWDEVKGFNDHPDRVKWTGGEQDLTPDGGKMHSIIVHPDDPSHMYLGMSGGGFFETKDRGKTWARMNKGCDRVFDSPDADDGHDPHCVRMAPSDSNRLWMQNHCGIYRVDRPSDTWVRVGKAMPKAIGDVGFPMTVHPRDPDTVWVFPMDGTQVWPRTSIDGKPAVYKTSNAGKTWQRQDKGMPKQQAWFTVKRQAMNADTEAKVGLYFGTTSGEVWMSRDEGASWAPIAQHLPHIYSIETARA